MTGRASILYELLLPYAQRAALGMPEICVGSVARYLGLLAATMSRWDEAEHHFEHAVEVNGRTGARPWLAYTLEDYARLLRRLNRPGDDERAQELVDRVLATYRGLEMDSHAAQIAELR
jgi:hypothetical protein